MTKSPAREWHKSSYSNGGTNCVEARESELGADVRDSQHPNLGHLSFSRGEWTSLLQQVKSQNPS